MIVFRVICPNLQLLIFHMLGLQIIKLLFQDHTFNTDILNKDFLGLECVNNKSPNHLSVIQAYLQQYERFNPHPFYLDSAANYLSKIQLLTKVSMYTFITCF